MRVTELDIPKEETSLLMRKVIEKALNDLVGPLSMSELAAYGITPEEYADPTAETVWKIEAALSQDDTIISRTRMM